MLEKPEQLNNNAILLSAQGNYEDAIQHLKRAITLERENKLLWFNLGLTYRDQGNMDEAENALKMAHSIDSQNQEILETYATVCFAKKKLALAKQLCMKGLELNNENPNFWNLLGVVHFNKEDYDEACKYFEMAITINPFYADALYNLRDTYIELNNKQGQLAIQKQIDELKL